MNSDIYVLGVKNTIILHKLLYISDFWSISVIEK